MVKKTKKENNVGLETVVIRVLQLKKTRTKNGAIKKIKEIRPKATDKQINIALSNILNYVRNKREKRWEQYTWDEKHFLLTKRD